MKARCKICGYYDDVDLFLPYLDVHHGIICPICGSTDVDTSEINASEEAYEYGDNNKLIKK
jgi:predicted Zn-ribbon and HTH transcriptional regulator